MSVQVIESGGKPEYAVVPYAEYVALLEKAEMADDLIAFDRAVKSDEETLPHDQVVRLVNGESALKVWREHRALSQAALAVASGVPQPHIALIEGGKRRPGVVVLKKLAVALGVELADLAG